MFGLVAQNKHKCVGNPRVTPEVTRDVCLLARMMAANLYVSSIEDLMFEVLFSVFQFGVLSFFALLGCCLNFI